MNNSTNILIHLLILVSLKDGVVHKVIFDYFEYQIIGTLIEYNYIQKSKC